ncbi:MAG: metal-dependent hydrolase [Pirellulales bacterium]|nr:metal-dependent hydrolase [Pirellulales bacterium]
MTFFEHAWIGADGALALGLHRRYGWPIVALAAVESVLPDWDGLSFVLGIQAYAAGHRVWGHNLLVAALVAAVTALVAYRWDWLPKARRVVARHWSAISAGKECEAAARHSIVDAIVWMAVAVAAAFGHLLADLVYSAGRSLPVWKLPLLWPFSYQIFAYPMVPWGDAGATILLVAGMFAMVRWPCRAQSIAGVTLGTVIAYILIRGASFG